ncbi:MAG: very short patch repair endonuclease [Oscillospiraceae bacterium]|nr:very short patch repair endonuclease [Oscillospiraceae bacterium]
MADVFSKEKRSEIMRKVKSNKNKSTELKLLQYFKDNKITGWRRNVKLYGKPDYVFPKKKVAVFVDGCFWHGHDCRNTHPKDNEDYWTKKIARNKNRDIEVTAHLEKLGYTVIRIWECDIKKNKIDEKIK